MFKRLSTIVLAGSTATSSCSSIVASSTKQESRRGLNEKMLEDVYWQESFESLQKFKESETYPGPIKAATPGDTRFYDFPDRELGTVYEQETLLHDHERHYWRPVVDDPLVQKMVTLRIKFKEDSLEQPQWVNKLHVITIVSPPEATIQEVIDQIKFENSHAFISHLPFFLTLNGQQLDMNKSIAEYPEIKENTALDALNTASDHLYHLGATEGARPKDWNVDEITDGEMRTSPYAEISEGRSISESVPKRPMVFTQPPERIRMQSHILK